MDTWGSDWWEMMRVSLPLMRNFYRVMKHLENPCYIFSLSMLPELTQKLSLSPCSFDYRTKNLTTSKKYW
jgi:hypothetical protein